MWFSNPIPSVPVAEAVEKIKAENVALIDVRTPSEYANGHAAGARNYPLGDMNESQAEALKKFKEVYVICQSGGRSATATTKLRAAGVEAINVAGGTSAWHASGLPMS